MLLNRCFGVRVSYLMQLIETVFRDTDQRALASFLLPRTNLCVCHLRRPAFQGFSCSFFSTRDSLLSVYRRAFMVRSHCQVVMVVGDFRSLFFYDP